MAAAAARDRPYHGGYEDVALPRRYRQQHQAGIVVLAVACHRWAPRHRFRCRWEEVVG